jgi:alkanesulfonate monooxygenase SsuD/methylene tetrahydromethanopterin reductase-like flavin-dependent oxidoreductase (luciferase family)
MANSFRNPGLLAKAAATLDHVSGGRLTLGLGTGANERDHVAFGIEGGGRGADSLGFGRLTEAVPLLRRLLDGETVTHHGPHYRLEAALCSPRPLQRRLPILIGGTGPRRTLPLVAAHADAWNAAGPLDAVTSAAKRLDELCDEIGRDPTSIERTLVKGIAIRRDRRQAREVFMAALRHNGEADPEGYAPVVGTPAEVAAELRPFVELGFRHVLCSLPSPFDAETIERLGEVRALLG